MLGRIIRTRPIGIKQIQKSFGCACHNHGRNKCLFCGISKSNSRSLTTITNKMPREFQSQPGSQQINQNRFSNINEDSVSNEDKIKEIYGLIKSEDATNLGYSVFKNNDFNEAEKNSLKNLLQHQINIIDAKLHNNYIHNYLYFGMFLGTFCPSVILYQNIHYGGIMLSTIPLIASLNPSKTKKELTLFKSILTEVSK